MTTALHKPVARRCLVAGDAGRRLVVELLPGDTIGFRLVRGRQRFYLPLIACYHMAVKAHVAARRAEKARGRK